MSMYCRFFEGVLSVKNENFTQFMQVFLKKSFYNTKCPLHTQHCGYNKVQLFILKNLVLGQFIVELK